MTALPRVNISNLLSKLPRRIALAKDTACIQAALDDIDTATATVKSFKASFGLNFMCELSHKLGVYTTEWTELHFMHAPGEKRKRDKAAKAKAKPKPANEDDDDEEHDGEPWDEWDEWDEAEEDEWPPADALDDLNNVCWKQAMMYSSAPVECYNLRGHKDRPEFGLSSISRCYMSVHNIRKKLCSLAFVRPACRVWA